MGPIEAVQHTWFLGELNNADLEAVPISAVQHAWFVREPNNAGLEVLGPIKAVQHAWFVRESNNVDLVVVVLSEQCSMHGLWESITM